MSEINKDIRYWTNNLKKANNQGALNEVDQILLEKTGKNLDVFLKTGSAIDLILQCMEYDSSALDAILDNAGVSLANTVLRDSLISNLQLKGVSPEEIVKTLGDIGIDIDIDDIPVIEEGKIGEEVTVQGSLFEVPNDLGIGAFISKLLGVNKDKEVEDESSYFKEFSSYVSKNFDAVCDAVGSMKKGEDEKVYRKTKDKDGSVVGMTLHGDLDKYISNTISSILAFGEEVDLESLKTKAKALCLKGDKVVKVTDDGVEVTANEDHDNEMISAAREGSKNLVKQIQANNLRNNIIDNSQTVEFTQRSNVFAAAAAAAAAEKMENKDKESKANLAGMQQSRSNIFASVASAARKTESKGEKSNGRMSAIEALEARMAEKRQALTKEVSKSDIIKHVEELASETKQLASKAEILAKELAGNLSKDEKQSLQESPLVKDEVIGKHTAGVINSRSDASTRGDGGRE